MARPTIYSDEMADRICEALAGGQSLNAICKDKSLPCRDTCRVWANTSSHPFSAKYARARAVGYAGMAEDILDIADENDDRVEARKLQIEARKWILAKMLPKTFGDRQTVDTTFNGTLTVRDERPSLRVMLGLDPGKPVTMAALKAIEDRTIEGEAE